MAKVRSFLGKHFVRPEVVMSGNFSDIHIRMHADTKYVFITLFL